MPWWLDTLGEHHSSLEHAMVVRHVRSPFLTTEMARRLDTLGVQFRPSNKSYFSLGIDTVVRPVRSFKVQVPRTPVLGPKSHIWSFSTKFSEISCFLTK